MKTMDRIPLAITFAAALWAGNLHAQSQADAQASPAGQPTEQQAAPDTTFQGPDSAVDFSRQPPEVPALDGSGVISMDLIQRFGFLIGGTVSSGFDSDPLNLGNSKSATTYSFSPYIGLQATTDRTQYVFQYHPTISRYTNYAGETMHLASAKIAGTITPRLSWAVGATGSHGVDSLRLLEPTQSIVAGGVPGSGASSGSFLPNAGTVTSVDGGIDFHYDASLRDSVGLHVGSSYNSFPALHQTGSIATTDLNYNHSLKPTLSLIIYEQNAEYFGSLRCAAFGAGVGLQWQAQESTRISLRGGPQIDTPGCKSQQGFSYNASVTRKLQRRSQLYITADRQPVISYLGSGLWQDDVSGGYEQRFQTSNALSFDAGYIHSSTLVKTGAYHGAFFDSSYVRQIRRGLSLRGSYRTFTGSSGNTGINRNILQFALTFTPNTHTLSQ